MKEHFVSCQSSPLVQLLETNERLEAENKGRQEVIDAFHTYYCWDAVTPADDERKHLLWNIWTEKAEKYQTIKYEVIWKKLE